MTLSRKTEMKKEQTELNAPAARVCFARKKAARYSR